MAEEKKFVNVLFEPDEFDDEPYDIPYEDDMLPEEDFQDEFSEEGDWED